MTAAVTLYVGDPDTPTEIGEDCDGLGVSWNAMTEPEWEFRYATAPQSAWVPGDVLMSAVLAAGAVPVAVVVRGSSLSDLQTRKAALALALASWPATFEAKADAGAETAVTVMGPWEAFPTTPRWGDVQVDLLGRYAALGTFAVPVNPVGAP